MLDWIFWVHVFNHRSSVSEVYYIGLSSFERFSRVFFLYKCGSSDSLPVKRASKVSDKADQVEGIR